MLQRIFTQIVLIGVCLFSLYLCSLGLDRSLWLDESWVANSLLAPTLQQCFFYDAWLQTSPPLFLILARIPIGLFGASNLTLRMVPFLMTAVAALFSGLLFRRHLSRPYFLCAFVLVFCSPLVAYRAQDLKQYSTEMASAAILLYLLSRYRESPTQRRFLVILVVSDLMIWLANATAFVIPGILVAIALSTPGAIKQKMVRSMAYGASTALSLVALYFFFIRWNWSPALAEFFRATTRRFALQGELIDSARMLFKALAVPPEIAVSAVVAAFTLTWVVLPALFQISRGRSGRHWAIYIACLSPCLLLVLARILGLYPMVERTLVFVLPGMVLLFLLSLETAANVLPRRLRRATAYGLLLLCFASVGWTYRRRGFESFAVPVEDNQAAVGYLVESARQTDIVYVHSSLEEPYKLYSRLRGGGELTARFGNSGAPCCPRNKPFRGGKASAGEALADFERVIGAPLPPRLWLLFTLRQDHWAFAGIDESRLLYNNLRERGCVALPTPEFRAVILVNMICP